MVKPSAFYAELIDLDNFLIGREMKVFTKLLVTLLVICIVLPVYSQEEPQPQAGVNLKVGENFYFEGNINDSANDDKEESMAEIQKTPFYKSTWFITTCAVIVIAGAAVGIYYGTRTDEPNGKTVEWDNK